MIQARYTLTRADLYDAHLHHAGWTFRVVQVFGALLFIAGVVGIVLRQYGGAAITMVAGSIMMFRLWLISKSSFKRDFAHHDETTASVSEPGVEFVNRKGSSSIKWIAVPKYSETKRGFMLYLQSNAFHIIPKRALTPEDTNALRNMLQRHVVTKPRALTDRVPPKAMFLLLVIAVALVLVFLAVRRIN